MFFLFFFHSIIQSTFDHLKLSIFATTNIPEYRVIYLKSIWGRLLVFEIPVFSSYFDVSIYIIYTYEILFETFMRKSYFIRHTKKKEKKSKLNTEHWASSTFAYKDITYLWCIRHLMPALCKHFMLLLLLLLLVGVISYRTPCWMHSMFTICGEKNPIPRNLKTDWYFMRDYNNPKEKKNMKNGENGWISRLENDSKQCGGRGCWKCINEITLSQCWNMSIKILSYSLHSTPHTLPTLHVFPINENEVTENIL